MKRMLRSAAVLLLALSILLSLAIVASAVELKTGIGIVNVNGLRLRAKPSTSAQVLDSANLDDAVVILKESGDFYLVDYNLQIGYMAKSYITFKDRENVELGYADVVEKSVNMRTAPSTDGAFLAKLVPGDKPYIIGFNCGWYKVTLGDLTGYVRSDLLALTEKPKENTNGAADYVSEGQKIVNLADDFLGLGYVWGGTSPIYGFDCSGFTQYVFGQMGYELDRTAAQQMCNNGTPVTNLEIGDLVFFERTYATNEIASHVGIYVGDNKFIHSGGSCVQITSMDHAFYGPRYVGARRILD